MDVITAERDDYNGRMPNLRACKDSVEYLGTMP
jgi:hypothetical protein